METINKEEMETKDKMDSLMEWHAHSEEEMKVKMDALTEQDIAVFDEVGVAPIKKVQSDAHVVVLCLEGRGSVTIEGKSYDVGQNDMFICHPHQFIENVMMSYDFKFKGLLMSPRYFQSIFFLPGKIWKAGLDIRRIPVFHLEDKDVEGFLVNFEMLRYKLSRIDLPHHQQTIKLLLQSLVYEMYDVLAPKLQLKENVEYGYSSGEILFGRFANLLAAEIPLRHPVGYYADKLCITPKYLSSICKKQTGKTASDIIDEMTVNYIKQMLTSSEKSIKEIAADAGFDNLSFFGKYVKRELGMSPRDYRVKQ